MNYTSAGMNPIRLIPPCGDLPGWARLLRIARHFFDSRGFIEVTTDHLVPAGAVEGTIDTLRVITSEGNVELHTSPEIEMKCLLAKNSRAIYQICRCFRDDPTATGIHRKEFTMLEFYRPSARYINVQQDMRELLQILAEKELAFEQWTVRDVVLDRTGIDLGRCTSATELSAAIEEKGAVAISAGDTWEDLFFKLMIERVEPTLPPDVPVLVRDFPLSVSVLSESQPIASGDPFWAERFEIYWYGMELCNGCTELVNATELRRRLRKENKLRRLQHKEPHPPPAKLLEAMASGLPPSSGVAVGLDRLFTCLQHHARL